MQIVLIVSLLFVLTILMWALLGGQGTDTSAYDGTERRTDPRRETVTEAREPAIAPTSADGKIDTDHSTTQTGPRDDDSSVARRKAEKPKGSHLPWPVDTLIPENSTHRVFRKIILNAERFIERGDIDNAIALYQGVKNRIQDPEIQSKIDENIEYLLSLAESRDEKKKELQRRIESGDDLDEPQEIRLRVEGPVPQTVRIGLPGYNDPVNPELLAEQISSRLKESISSLKDDMDALRNRPNENNSEEIERLEKDLAEMRALMQAHAEERDRTRRELEKLKDNRHRDDLERLRRELSQVGDLREDLNDLNRRLNDIHRPQESVEPPRIPQAHYSGPVPVTIDPAPLLDLLERLPKENAPEAEEITIPDTNEPAPENDVDLDEIEEIFKEHTKEPPKEEEEPELLKEPEEDPNDFDLLNDLIDGKDDDTLTDEDIFEKILRDDSHTRDERDFEIIGDQHEEEEEFSIRDVELDKQRREDQDFYRELLKTDKRKKKELPILRVTYDFSRLPDEMSLAKEKNILQHSFYKYKPLLQKAEEYIKKRKVRDAINYYKVVLDQNIPYEFKSMIRKNIRDLTEYLEKYLMAD